MSRSLPNTTAALVTFLSAAVSVPFATAVPRVRPLEFGVVTATGGGVRNLAQAQPTFSVECWAATSVRAAQMARTAWSALDAADGTFIADGVWVGDANLTLPVDFPDALSDTPRWLFVFQPTVNLTIT